MVVIPGFGATNDSGVGPYLTDIIIQHARDTNPIITLTSNSPAAPDFVHKSHTSGIPGNQKVDAQNLYDMILASIRRLEELPPWRGKKYQIKKVSVIGCFSRIHECHPSYGA